MGNIKSHCTICEHKVLDKSLLVFNCVHIEAHLYRYQLWFVSVFYIPKSIINSHVRLKKIIIQRAVKHC